MEQPHVVLTPESSSATPDAPDPEEGDPLLIICRLLVSFSEHKCKSKLCN